MSNSTRHTFTDLPGEIRNSIYLLLLNDEGINAILDHEDGKYRPFGFRRLLYTIHNQNGDVVQRKTAYPVPVIFQLNKQIRREARSLYIIDRLQVDVRGFDGTNPSAFDKNNKLNVGLRRLEQWAVDNLQEHERREIKTLVIQDRAKIINSGGFSSRPTANQLPAWIESSFYNLRDRDFFAILPAFKIEADTTSNVLTAFTPLRLVASQAEELQDFLVRVSQDAAARKTPSFDGNDVLATVRFLRTTTTAPWTDSGVIRLAEHGSCTSESVRFRMIAEADDAACNVTEAVVQFKYVAAMVRLSDVEKA